MKILPSFTISWRFPCSFSLWKLCVRKTFMRIRSLISNYMQFRLLNFCGRQENLTRMNAHTNNPHQNFLVKLLFFYLKCFNLHWWKWKGKYELTGCEFWCCFATVIKFEFQIVFYVDDYDNMQHVDLISHVNVNENRK